MLQDSLIQIRVRPEIKSALRQIAAKRGLTLSALIKFVVTEHVKSDPLWNKIENDGVKTEILDEFITLIHKKKSK